MLTKRRQRILEILQKEGMVETSSLSKKFNVSFMTIRRDLLFFEKQGIINTTHGGATLIEGATAEPALDVKQTQMMGEKKAIGKAAADLVKDGMAIFIDCGSTTKEVASALKDMKNLTVVTNSLLVANTLSYYKNIKLIMLPGVFRQKSLGFYGISTVNSLNKMHIDIGFIGTEGIDAKRGATVPDIEDSELKRAIAEVSSKVVVVADHKKIGKSFFSSFLEIKRIHTLITGEAAPKDNLDTLRNLGVEVVLAN